MTRILIAPLLLATLTLSGCGSLLADMEANPIEDEPVERTLGRQIEDESVETKAMVNIRAADDRFDDAHLTVVSYNGFVLLVGQVQSEALKNTASEVVRKIRGVRRIYNELEVAAPSSGMTRTSDTWITTKVKSWLIGHSATPGLRVKVVTENGVVYLMGLATQAEADRVADVAAGLSGVQRVVRLFEIVPA
jgi:osmotically-inducible protein OsmY